MRNSFWLVIILLALLPACGGSLDFFTDSGSPATTNQQDGIVDSITDNGATAATSNKVGAAKIGSATLE